MKFAKVFPMAKFKVKISTKDLKILKLTYLSFSVKFFSSSNLWQLFRRCGNFFFSANFCTWYTRSVRMYECPLWFVSCFTCNTTYLWWMKRQQCEIGASEKSLRIHEENKSFVVPATKAGLLLMDSIKTLIQTNTTVWVTIDG